MAHLTGCSISSSENPAKFVFFAGHSGTNSPDSSFLAGESLSPAKFGEVRIGEQSWQVEIADDNISRQYGLMFRENLAKNSGMLFVFDTPAPHSFWMKNTLIPLDLLWISADKKVVDVQTLQPCQKDPCPSYRPQADALYVLEINAGNFRGNLGDSVEISL